MSDFDRMTEQFTRACLAAADWKHRQFGAAYATRIRAAIADLKAGIAIVEAHPEIGFVEPKGGK